MAVQSNYVINSQLFEASGMIISTSPAALSCSYNPQELIEYEATTIDSGAQRKGRKGRKLRTQLDAWLNEETKEGAWNALADARFEKTSDPSNEVGSVCDDILIKFEDPMDDRCVNMETRKLGEPRCAKESRPTIILRRAAP